MTNIIENSEYSLPFYKYQKVVTKDSETGEEKVQKKFIKKPYEEIMSDVVILVSSATGINLVCNGISHLINSIKRKK